MAGQGKHRSLVWLIVLLLLCGSLATCSAEQREQASDNTTAVGARRHKRFIGGLVDAISCLFGQIFVNGACEDPEPKCNGQTTGDGACDAYYANSHLIDTGGNVITSVNGDCPSDNNCNCPTPGFYSTGGTCAICTDIANCNYETCSSGSNQICSYCEGVVQDIPGWRAYKMSSDQRSCDQACSWRPDSNRCFPGSCSTELVGSCVCATSFSGHHCRTISEYPDIKFNSLTLTTTGTNAIFPPDPNSGPSATQDDVWTNDINPDTIVYRFDSQYIRAIPSFPAYIKSATVGVSATNAEFRLYNKAGSQKGSTMYGSCSGISATSPNTNIFTCTETFQSSTFSGFLPTPFAHEDWIEFKYMATAGGHVVYEDKENNNYQITDYFQTTVTTHTFQVHFDTVQPYHCLTSCSDSMLDTEQIITTADVTITWGGWADDAAGLWKFGYRVYELVPINNILQHDSIDVHGTVSTNTASGSTTFSLNGPAGIYAVILDCYDRADNIKSARKLVLYDDGSQITRNPSSPLRVTSAASVTSWEWQQTEGPFTMTWTGRYTNVFHDHNKVLNEVAPEIDVVSSYDDSEGNMTTSHHDNVLGIVKFTTAYLIDQQGGTTLSLPPDASFSLESDLTATNTYQAGLVDGDTLTFWVRAYDIRSEYDEESVTFHVDSSPPIIENLWLTKDHILNLSVHGIDELSQMTMEWEAYDIHSGLKVVQWRVFDNFTGTDLVSGHEFVTAQGQMADLATCQSQWGSYIRGPNCYCTGPVGCYHRHFQVKPLIIDSNIYSHGGMFHDMNTPVHDYDYFMEVTVYNHANLSTTLTRQITVDLSPPHPGQVHDGVSGSPEEDYKSTTDLHAYWWGFFDRESGVKYYQYAFDTACVAASVFSHELTDSRVNQTYEQFASWTAPGDGTYYVTVVAFNSAREPSVPVCSDGVIVDTVPPTMEAFFVEGAYIEPGLVPGSTAAEVWYMDSERRVRLVDSPDAACTSAASGVSVTLNMYAVSPLSTPMNATEACVAGALDSKFLDTFYLSTDKHLFLNWTGNDASSGIYDYEVGLATTSAATVPDISGFESTNHHTFYKQYHPTLTEGTPFYILIKAIDKAGVEFVQALGPVELVRTAPTYTGSVTLDLTPDSLKATWDNSLFTDIETSLLDFSVALEEQTGGAVLKPHALPHFSGTCVSSSPPTCATFPLADLHWGLHEQHVYVAKVKVTNIVGLHLQLTSATYTHDTRVAAAGSVYEVVPSSEVATLGIQRSEDTDFQLSTSSLEAAWSGFGDGSIPVTYTVGLGTSAGSDDVSSFTTASSQTGHTFTGLSLSVDSKYYVTVEAATTAGSTTVSSDGVTVIQADQSESSITVKDGPGCNVTNIGSWTPEHHGDMISVPCEDDAEFQTSLDTLWAHWTMTAAQRLRYPDVVYKVQKNIPGTSSWPDVTTYTSSSRNDVILAQGLPLQAGGQYRLAVKFCVSQACTLPVFSAGVYVITTPPVTGAMAVEHSNSTGVSTLTVTIEEFRDADITDLTMAQSTVLGYQWSLSHRTEDSTEPMLTTWADVAAVQTVNGTFGTFTLTLSGELSFHKCLILTVRGVNKVGLVSRKSADVMDCAAIDPQLVVANTVLDTVGLTVEGSPSEGLPITLGFTDAWTAEDDDYTAHSNILSAVWPTVRQSQVTWAVLESPGPDVTSHFVDPSSQPPQDPCASPLQIACGQLTTQKYINVEFGGTSSLPALQNGHHYYVCLYAAAESVPYEKWVEELPEVVSCSDGITVDLTPPVAGTVVVDGLRSGIYQTSLSVITLRWNGFTDIEDMGLTAHHSGILSYQIAVGSVEGGQDVLKFLDVGLVNYYTLHSLVMQDGHVYYVTVKALDMVGRTVTASSSGFVVDSTIPARTSANFRFAQPYFTSPDTVDLCWTDMFNDAESGLDFYVLTIGSRPGHDDIMLGQRGSTDCGVFTTDVSMINGHAYYVTIGAVNGAGLEAVDTSKPVVVLTTTPSPGAVFDGPVPATVATTADLDFVTSPSEVEAFWSGFSTPLNPVASYTVSLGTCPGCVDVIADFDIGLSQEVTWDHAPLRHDIRYYTTVTACNAVGQCNQATSDGVMIDVTPPVAGPVWDGTGDEDIAFQSHTDFLGAQWRGFSDLGSGLTGFTWRAGTTVGGSDVMPERDVGLVFYAFTKDLPSSLPVGQTIYITVKATDAAGNQKEVTSNGFQVDTSAPVTSTTPELLPGVGTLDSTGLMSRDTIGVRWAIEDSESDIVTQYLSVHSHIYGEFQSSSVQVPGPARKHIFTALTLHDGSVYKVRVTACNLARLCTTAETADILHDSSLPSTGMFAIETDHTAYLTRHLATWMEWTSSTLRLAWLGFHDEHSGISSYLVNVGTTPYASDLNQGGTTATVTHSNSGTSYEDEGYVQVYQLSTNTLTALQDVYITVWAINGVGLKSHPAMSEFRLQTGGALFLHRRCSAFNCLSHCSCAIQGAPCGAATTCTDYTGTSNPNSMLTVLDHADLTVLGTSSPSADLYQPSQSYLAATWSVTTSQGQLPIRYEVSAGRDDQTTPMGVFSLSYDRVWRDVGLETSSIVMVPEGTLMNDKVAYSTFVRTWYADGSYAIFKSTGITPIIYRPTVTNLVGRAVKEHTTSGTTKDVDYVTSSSTMYISWDGNFVSTSAPVTTFNVYIGTSPEAADVFSTSVSGSDSSTMVTGLSLQEITLYYSTVTAEGGSGLLAWTVSDGFILDTQVPEAGMVMDGTALDDVDYQPSDAMASANWRGFYDAGSGVRRYMWCVGTTSDTSLCDVIAWTDVGLSTSTSASISPTVAQGTTLYSKVYAQDAAGHSSQVMVSDGVTVDTSAPSVLSMVYTNGINFLYNPSFETDTAANSDLSQCDATPPTSWQLGSDSCVTLHRPTHVVSAEGVQHLVLWGTLEQTVTGLTTGAVYRLSLRMAHPHNALTSQKPVKGHVTLGTMVTPFELDPSLCRGVCDSDVEPVMLWHSFSFIVTASSTSMVVSISTSVPSLDQQVALDNVMFEQIQELATPGGSSEDSVKSSGVFLAEWSVVQTSWHFTDDVSPIVDYQWALGTSQGGVQLQGFRSVGRRQHASLSGLSLSHGTTLHVTVLARNAAGTTSIAHSLPLVADMTGPDIVDLRDGASGDDVDYQTATVVSARWTVSDNQSAIGDCQWAIGTLSGRGDVQSFQLATPTSTATYSVSADVTSALSSLSLTLPTTLYINVRCYNLAGLPARATTDGVTIVSSSQNQQMGTLRLLPDSRTQYPVMESCQAYQETLRLRWGSIASQIPVAGYEIGRSSGSGQDISRTPSLPYLLDGADLNLTQTLLTADSNYTITVDPVDIFGTVNAGLSRTTYVLPAAPTINANDAVTSSRSGTDLTLTWPNLFTSVLDLYFEVTAGSVEGGGDILQWQQTQDTNVVISLQYAQANSFNMSLVVTAIDACGQFVTHKQGIDVGP